MAALALALPACVEDPFDMGQPRSCEVADQNLWLDDLLRRVYLWNDELPDDLDPTSFDSPDAFLAAMRAAPDRWSRIDDAEASKNLFELGQFVGLGFRTRRDPEDRVRVASVHPESPAGFAGLRRGDVVEAVNALGVMEIDEQGLWDQVYGTDTPGVTVQMTVSRNGVPLDVFMTKTTVSIETVPTTRVLELGPRKVGYVVFESFLEPANQALGDAFVQLGQAGIDDLIVDLRYNGGGLLDVALNLASFIAGRRADGEVFYRVEHNRQLREEDWKRRLAVLGASVDVDRVVFITTGSTLSASELVINGLAPHVETHVIGSVTGGKPVGSMRWSFCESTIFPITFRLVNDAGVTDYFEGLTPECAAPDDLDHALGDVAEGSLAEALHLLQTGECTHAALMGPSIQPGPGRADALGELLGGSW